MKYVRKAISKKIRFEVLKRDCFTCQYCGKTPPEAILEIDHIEPVAEGGSNEILNLVTSCRDCNSGKSARTLDDSAVLKKQHKQLAVMQDRLEQQKLQLNWKKQLVSVNEAAVDVLEDYWYELTLTGELKLNSNGRNRLKALVRKYRPEEIMEAMCLSSQQYLYFETNEAGEESVVRESWEEAWGKISGICYCRKLDEKNPGSGRVPYILGILRNRLSSVNEHVARELLQLASQTVEVAELENHAKVGRYWSQWGGEINQRIDQDEEHLENLRLAWGASNAGMIEMPQDFDFEMKSLMKDFCKCSVTEIRNISGLYKAIEFSLEQHASHDQVFVSEDPGLRTGDGDRPTRPSDVSAQKAFNDLRNVCIYLDECDSEGGFSAVFDSSDQTLH